MIMLYNVRDQIYSGGGNFQKKNLKHLQISASSTLFGMLLGLYLFNNAIACKQLSFSPENDLKKYTTDRVRKAANCMLRDG